MIAIRRVIGCSLIIYAIVMHSSCRKSTRFDPDYFVFGDSYNECEGDCAHYFMLSNGKLYEDAFDKKPKRLKFKRKSLSDDQREIANKLFVNFPEFLKNDTGSTFGAPDSRDQGELYIELKERGKKSVNWRIDWDESHVPNEIQEYVKQMKKDIQTIYLH